ncbi:MAG: signal recognition particle-docking protein FtsY [Deltaproteobacteria bacterium]|nr:signal recognition particle-docking protein FtsY [Deltaproteobacteria bacterium]
MKQRQLGEDEPQTGRSPGKRRTSESSEQADRIAAQAPTVDDEEAAVDQTADDYGDDEPIDEAEEQRRLSAGLAKTRSGFVARLGRVFRGKQIDESLLDDIEEVLFTADIGVKTSQQLLEAVRKQLSKKQLKDSSEIIARLKEEALVLLDKPQATPFDPARAKSKPYVLLVVGVNGVGKTTTIGKLAAQLKARGLSVLLAAGDTFRAAATEQLVIWGERTATPVVGGKEGADPASVIVDALRKAKADGADVVIADTAGRLHTKISLMDELQKVRRAIAKQVDGAPHETWIVVDATTGQNAITQARQFGEALELTGVVLTKLDGTAKGGVILGICNELSLPVRFVGIGEAVADLRTFDSQRFADALFDEESGS